MTLYKPLVEIQWFKVNNVTISLSHPFKNFNLMLPRSSGH